jgi:hypothetical protein
MRNLVAAIVLTLVLFAVPAHANDVAFTHVTVVDVVEGRLVPTRWCGLLALA